MKKTICLLVAIAIAFSCTACSTTITKKERYKNSFLDLFDTVSSVIAYDTSQESFDQHYDQFYAELQEYDHLYDIYHYYEGINNLYVINKSAGESPVKVDSRIIDLLEYGKEVYDMSGGRTNICFGPVLALWHNERTIAGDDPTQAKLPDMDQLKAASEHTDISDLVIDRDASTVYFKDPEMRLDVGAIAKGYAVQKVAEYAQENLWSSAAISVGGNVLTYGYKNDDGKTKWNIGLENPDVTAGDYLFNLKVSGVSIVTSGDYQRYYTVDGKKYCHIINPDTLMPSEYVASVSIICNDSALGDALSTSLFNMSIEDGKELVESMDGVEAVWVDKNYKKTFSSDFKKYIDDKGADSNE